MIRRALVYFLVITLLLFALRTLHYKGLLKNKGYYEKYKTIFWEKNNFNVLFLGSSRAEMHYDTALFDSLTQQNSFNVSMAGASPQLAFAALKTYLSNSQPPAYLIYELDYHSLKINNGQIKDFNNYFPFLSGRLLRQQLNNIDDRMNNFYYNPYYSWPFTGFKNLSTSLHGYLKIPNKTDSLYYKGFVREVLRPSLIFIPTTPYYSYFNITNRNYLDSIITLCKSSHINLSLVSSPMFAGGKTGLMNKTQITSQVYNIAKINHIRYFDLSSLPFCSQRNLFVDHYHMNYRGARKFTRVLGKIFNNKIINNSLN